MAVRHHDAWHLTDEGLSVARSRPESLGLCLDQPITEPASAAAYAADALRTIALGLLFRRQHHAAYSGKSPGGVGRAGEPGSSGSP